MGLAKLKASRALFASAQSLKAVPFDADEGATSFEDLAMQHGDAGSDDADDESAASLKTGGPGYKEGYRPPAPTAVTGDSHAEAGDGSGASNAAVMVDSDTEGGDGSRASSGSQPSPRSSKWGRVKLGVTTGAFAGVDAEGGSGSPGGSPRLWERSQEMRDSAGNKFLGAARQVMKARPADLKSLATGAMGNVAKVMVTL